MEQELTNQLNKKIIEQFIDTHNDIRTKIDALNRLKENTKLDDDLTSRMNKTINDLNVACIKLEDQINIMNEKAKKGIYDTEGLVSLVFKPLIDSTWFIATSFCGCFTGK